MKKLLSLQVILAFSLLLPCLNLVADDRPSTQAANKNSMYGSNYSEHEYAFINDVQPTAVAKDLHILFQQKIQIPLFRDKPTPPGAFGNYNPNTADEFNLFGPGNGLAPGETATFTMGFLSKEPSRVLGYWWTKDGSSNHIWDKTNLLGPKYGNQPKGKFVFGTPLSTGNGKVKVNSHGKQYIFETPPGIPGEMTAAHFALFIEAIPFAVVDSVSGYQPVLLNQVIIFFTIYDGIYPNFSVEIIPDSTQPVGFTYIEPEVIPTLSQWALIILALLLLAAGTAYIRKRHVAFAFAGVADVPGEKRSLFIRRSYFFILAILWGVLLIVFTFDKILFNALPVRDIIGTLVSCLIVAYILHLVEAFRRGR